MPTVAVWKRMYFHQAMMKAYCDFSRWVRTIFDPTT
jgi:hypothetical protein